MRRERIARSLKGNAALSFNCSIWRSKTEGRRPSILASSNAFRYCCGDMPCVSIMNALRASYEGLAGKEEEIVSKTSVGNARRTALNFCSDVNGELLHSSSM